MGFATLGLSDLVMQGVRAAGYATPTPIQSLVIGPALKGRDIIGCSHTGSGKTAAFVLPLLQRLAGAQVAHPKRDHIRALIITPTRELAQQVQDAVSTYGRFLTLRAVSVYGGVNMDDQVKALGRGADIVIATPGRLLDHVRRRAIDLSHVQVLVLDEADRMLDMGFIKDVRTIIAALPEDRQTMLFSATISEGINALAGAILHNPHLVEAGEKHNPAETITQHFYMTSQETKMDLLIHALATEKMESVLVFSRTKHGADKICRRLERNGVRVATIHSNRTQAQRQRALDGFKRGKFRVLVATDIAARGIDVEGISHVINYDIPHYAADYVHRIGRTGRAGASGDAITFIAHNDHQHLKGIQHFTGKRFAVTSYPGFTPSPVVRETSGHKHASNSHTARNAERHPVLSKKSAPRKSKQEPKHEALTPALGGVGWSNH